MDADLVGWNHGVLNIEESMAGTVDDGFTFQVTRFTDA